MSFAYKCAASWLWNIYNGVTSMLSKGDLELLPEVYFVYSNTKKMILIMVSIIFSYMDWRAV